MSVWKRRWRSLPLQAISWNCTDIAGIADERNDSCCFLSVRMWRSCLPIRAHILGLALKHLTLPMPSLQAWVFLFSWSCCLILQSGVHCTCRSGIILQEPAAVVGGQGRIKLGKHYCSAERGTGSGTGQHDFHRFQKVGDRNQ